MRAAGQAFPQRAAFRFFTAAAAWNFLGAGLLGGVLNPPIVNYYEHGEFLTLAHGHAAMFGTFRLLAIGLMYLALRGITSSDRWSDRLPTWSLWLFNAAIVLWLALNILPIGVAQVFAATGHGYWYARSLAFYNGWTLMQWLRFAGDTVFLIGGAVLLADVVAKLRQRRRATVGDGQPLVSQGPQRPAEQQPSERSHRGNRRGPGPQLRDVVHACASRRLCARHDVTCVVEQRSEWPKDVLGRGRAGRGGMRVGGRHGLGHSQSPAQPGTLLFAAGLNNYRELFGFLVLGVAQNLCLELGQAVRKRR
jgi:Cytochrome C and Quinol oxidase polypeptide I